MPLWPLGTVSGDAEATAAAAAKTISPAANDDPTQTDPKIAAKSDPIGDENNDRQASDFSSFWTDDEPKDEPAGDKTPVTPAVTPQDPMQQLNAVLDGISFKPVMNDETTEALGNNDPKAFNEAVQGQLRQAVRESLFLTARMVKTQQERMEAFVQKRIDSALQLDRDEVLLGKELPFSQRPEIQPIAQGIFANALKITKGDRAKAVAMTRAFFGNMAEVSAPDLNLAPAGEQEARVIANKEAEGIDWLAQMLIQE